MKKLLLLTPILLLVGCGTPASEPRHDGTVDTGFNVVKVNVDGDDVTCVIYRTLKSASLSCNWEAFNAEKRS